MNKEPRVLLFSPRKLAPVISRCFSYEFEDAICALDSVELVTPEPALGAAAFDSLNRGVNKVGRTTKAVSWFNPGVRQSKVSRRYQLFFAVCQFATDLNWLNALRGWRAHCDIAACWLEEIWAKDLGRLQSQLELLREFDFIFTNCSGSVDVLATATGRPVIYQPPGIDCLAFAPADSPEERVIDVFNMGRRHEATHQALLEMARAPGFFYLYDTFKGNIQVQNAAEHRFQLANLIKRTRYFIANKAKVTETGETGGQQEVGFRFFEGAAGGAVMIGDPPNVDAFRECFDWADAVIYLPYGSVDVADLVADLNREPERLGRISREGQVNALRRHDWAYRWRSVLGRVNLRPLPALAGREAQLERLASKLTEWTGTSRGSGAKNRRS